jgi:hypothetical protein
MIQSGRGDGHWNGHGIVTTLAAAQPPSSLTSLGIARADEAGRAGGTFGGVSVLAADTLVMYTYAGDANLDGRINIDDYAQIDSHVNLPGVAGWFNGDFNYDGKINVDDYGIIDFNIGVQGAPFSTSTEPFAGLAAVPEPGAIGVIALAALSLSSRARRASGRRSRR